MEDTDGITMSDDELLELYGYINAAGERHTHSVHSIVPGYIGIALDSDVIVQVRRLVVRKNTYYLATPEHAEEIGALDAEASTLWMLDFSNELERMAAALENGSVDEGAQGGEFTVAIRAVRAQDGKPITYEEVMTWAAIRDAMDAGDVDKAKRITKLAYPSIRFTDEPDEPAAIEAIRPTAHIVSNSKPALVLDNPSLYDSDGAALNVGSKKRRGAQLQIQFKLENDEGLSWQPSREDVAVLDAIQTLKGGGNTVITPWQIVENMGYNPTPKLVDEIHDRVLHLMGTLGTIDWSQQAKDWGIVDKETGLPLEEAKIIGQLAQLTVLDTTDAGGNRSIRYRIDGDTLTYQHANEVNQVIRYPPELLEMKPIDIDGKVRMRSTRDQKRIQRAVLRWVYMLKGSNGSRMADSIHYEKLWAYEGYAPKNDSARKRAVTHTHDVLRALKADGLIEDFEPVFEGRAGKQTQVRLIVGRQRRQLK